MITVWLSSRAHDRRKPSTSAPDRESRLPVGSSANTTCGRVISARAQATRCCWPPDSSAGRCRSRLASPVALITVSHHAGVGRGPGQLERQPDVLLGGQRGQQVEGLEDEPDAGPAQPGQRLVAEPGQLAAADADRPRGGRVQAGQAVHERGLAGAGRAHDGVELAAGELGADAVERADRGRAGTVHLDQIGRGGRRRAPVAAGASTGMLRSPLSLREGEQNARFRAARRASAWMLVLASAWRRTGSG